MSDYIPFTYVIVDVTNFSISINDTDQYKWCLENFGFSHRWWVVANSLNNAFSKTTNQQVISAKFCFDNASDALMFQLRWA